MFKVLAIETSCDETAAAVVSGDGLGPVIPQSSVISSQVALHAEYGGVYPDLAAREHTKKILPVIELSLKKSGLLADYSSTRMKSGGEVSDSSRLHSNSTDIQATLAKIDAIAVTVGPGLIGSLLVGVNAAAQLAELAQKPLLPINHWEGHLYSVFLKDEKNTSVPEFPVLFLTVSGGHTSLILMRDHFDYEILGNTIDDAAGEAFDKTARLIGLGYPGGPALSAAAAEAKNYELRTKNHELKLPRPMINSGDLNFSFSGLKTAVRYAIERKQVDPGKEGERNLLARKIEDAIVDVLIAKLKTAAEKYSPKSIAIVGGVSANQELRKRALHELGQIPNTKCQILLAPGEYTTDNAAMIGAAGLFRFAKKVGIAKSPQAVTANASLRLNQ